MDVHEKLEEHEKQLADHGRQLKGLHESKDRHQELIGKLDEDITEIKLLQAKMPTKDDIRDIHRKLDNNQNLTISTLRDAINAQPAKTGNKINTWILVATALGVIVAIVATLHGAG